MSGLIAQPKEAVRFLELFRPGGPWVLTAISVDQKNIETETFTDPAAAHAWIAQRDGTNQYFMVNPVMRPLSSKAAKTDVRGMDYLHVDVDPRINEPLDPERKRIRDLLFQFDPPPTFIIDSGGGFQAFWKLDATQAINGVETKAIELEAYNVQLELLLGADSCHNIDRIMRLPGTVNYPNEKKRKKGRVEALAMVVLAKPNIYPLNHFTPAQRIVQGKSSGTAGFVPTDTVKISGNLPRIDLDDLPPDVTQRTKMLCVQGNDPDDPTRYPSQSEVVFAVCCELVRGGCTDDQIAAVLLDKNLGVSGHIYRQPRPRDYAARQVRRARDKAIDPKLLELNDKHAVLSQEGGKTRVLSWERTELDGGRRVPVLQSFEDFRNRYMNIMVDAGHDKEGKPTKMPLGKWWLAHPLRRQYLAFRFVPGEGEELPGDDGEKYLNLWRGYSVAPTPGDWSLMQAHIEDVLAAGDMTAAAYIKKWAAYSIQRPDEQAEVALVFRGKKGSGKGAFGRTMRELFGQHGLQITASQHLTGRFNAHLRDCCLLFADEAIVPGDREAESVLKGIITEPVLTIEGKGVNLVQAKNRLHIIMSSNHAWVVPATIDERRFAIFDVPDKRIGDRAYFKALFAQLDNGGRAAMLYDLMQMDLGDWHPRENIPKNDARNKQIAASLGGFEKVMLDLLRVGEIPVEEWVTDYQPFVATSVMHEYAQRTSGRNDVTLNAVAGLLKELGAEKDRSRRPSGWILPSLADARRRWDEKKVPTHWANSADGWTALPGSNGTLALRDWEKKGEPPPDDPVSF